MAEVAQNTTPVGAAEPLQSGHMGMVKGLPGRHASEIGLLDLRGVNPDELKQVESLRNIGAVLLDENQRTSLAHVKVENVGAMVEIPLDCRVLVEPWQEFSKATVEAMAGG